MILLLMSTRCIFFSGAHLVRIPKLSVLDLEQFKDGRPLGKFLEKRASEDKARWKDSCCPIGTVVDPENGRYSFEVLKMVFNMIF